MSGVHPQHWWPCCVLVALISMGRIWNFWWNLHLPLSLRDEAAFFAVWLFQGIDSTSEDRGQFFTRLLNEISSLLTNVPWNSGMGKTSQQLAAARAKTELRSFIWLWTFQKPRVATYIKYACWELLCLYRLTPECRILIFIHLSQIWGKPELMLTSERNIIAISSSCYHKIP